MKMVDKRASDKKAKYAITQTGIQRQGSDDMGQLLYLFDPQSTLGDAIDSLGMSLPPRFDQMKFQYKRILANIHTLVSLAYQCGYLERV